MAPCCRIIGFGGNKWIKGRNQLEGKKYIGFVGTYTKKESKGIYSFVLDAEKGKIEDVKNVAEIGSPTYLAISEDNRYLYAVAKEGDKGGLAAYRIHREKNELEEINRQLADGPSPCYVAVDRACRLVMSANYHKGTVDAYWTRDDGGLHPIAFTVQHEGSGPDKDRQEKAHVHFAGFTPDERYIITVDLGIDRLDTYEWRDGQLHEVSSLGVKPGSGPRHLAFHPNGRIAYLMTELSSEVIVLKYDRDHGSFSEVQYISTIPEGYSQTNQGSAIHVSSDGRFVYAANRGHNSIVIFRTDEKTGCLTYVDHVPTEGNWPRDFVLDPSEQYLVAANERSGNLTLFKRDPETGGLSLRQAGISVPEAVCVKFFHD
jgi:6-phosphogluconolactonase (EC 3.1.1.31)